MNENIVLHACCGPCASACIPVLRGKSAAVLLYFANSNIDTREEWEKRLEAAKKLAAVEGVEIVSEPYNHEEWLREVASGYENEPEKGARCARCFQYNIAKAVKFAAKNGFGAVTSSLTISPHKVSAAVFKAGESAAEGSDVVFLEYDFKKKDGFLKSLTRSKELGLYRQTYCGCEFSKGA